jgi:hypothetical protein
MSSHLGPVRLSSRTHTWLQLGSVGAILVCLTGLVSSVVAKVQEAQDRMH